MDWVRVFFFFFFFFFDIRYTLIINSSAIIWGKDLAIIMGAVALFNFFFFLPGRVARMVPRLTQEPEVPGSMPGPATFFHFLLPLIQERQLSGTYESMCRHTG